jgi:hypothetical protein
MIERLLTDREIDLARTVFGDAIDYSIVKIFGAIPGVAGAIGIAPNGNIYMIGCYRADYAAENSHSRAHFIHEMTHVWQFQNKILNPVPAAIALNLKHKFNYLASYYYHLDETKDLTDYNMEQQASIIQEYFLNKHEGISYSYHCKNACNDNEKIQLYKKVLAKFLGNPSYAKRDHFPMPFLKGPKR